MTSLLQGTVLSGSMLLAVPVAVLAGLVSFLSPCVLPLVPGYLSYVTGLSGADLDRPRRGLVLAGTALFVAGFVVAVLLRSLLAIPQPVLDVAQLLQTILLGMALFGLGSGIRFRKLAGTGLATAVAGLGAWALIAVAAFAVTFA